MALGVHWIGEDQDSHFILLLSDLKVVDGNRGVEQLQSSREIAHNDIQTIVVVQIRNRSRGTHAKRQGHVIAQLHPSVRSFTEHGICFYADTVKKEDLPRLGAHSQ